MSVVLRALLVLLSLVRAEPSTRDVPYELERTWNSTLRYLRVDLKWTVRESCLSYLRFVWVIFQLVQR